MLPATAPAQPFSPHDAVDTVFADEARDLEFSRRQVVRRNGRRPVDMNWAWAGLLALLYRAGVPTRRKDERRRQEFVGGNPSAQAPDF